VQIKINPAKSARITAKILNKKHSNKWKSQTGPKFYEVQKCKIIKIINYGWSPSNLGNRKIALVENLREDSNGMNQLQSYFIPRIRCYASSPKPQEKLIKNRFIPKNRYW